MDTIGYSVSKLFNVCFDWNFRQKGCDAMRTSSNNHLKRCVRISLWRIVSASCCFFVFSLKFCNFNCIIFLCWAFNQHNSQNVHRAHCRLHTLVHSKYDYASIKFMNWDLLIVMWSSLCAVITLASIQLYHIFALWDAILSSTIAIDVLLLLVAK